MSSNKFLELRIYKIHHGRRTEFGDYMRDVLVRLFKGQDMEIVHHGPSLHDEDSYFLIRAHPSVEERQQGLDAIYGSAEWLMNHEEHVLDMIDSMDTAVFEVDEWLVEVIKERFAMPAPETNLVRQPK